MTNTNLYAVARRSVKKSDGNYGSEEMMVELSAELPQGATQEQRMQLADILFSECDAVLTAQLDGGPATAITAPETANALAVPAQSLAPVGAGTAATPPMSAEQVASHMGGVVEVPNHPSQYTGTEKQWAAARVNFLLENDQNQLAQEFWDNRADKRNPKAPDFKHKENGDWAVWL